MRLLQVLVGHFASGRSLFGGLVGQWVTFVFPQENALDVSVN